MANIVKKAVLGTTLAATALTVAAPAEAQRWRRYDRGGRGGDVAAGAVLGGIVGLGLGAAIASNNRNRYYDRGYYDRGYHPRRDFYNGYPRGYHDPRFRGRGYYGGGYGGGYYDRGYGYGYGQRCYTVRDFDPYSGRRFRTRVCD